MRRSGVPPGLWPTIQKSCETLTQIKALGLEARDAQAMKTKCLIPLTLTVTAFGAMFLTGCGPSANGSATTPPPGEPAQQPFTGQIHEIKMRGTPKGFFFEPEKVTVRQGDKVRFTMEDGGPHNVSFNSAVAPDATKIPDGAKMVLESQGRLVGALLQAPGQTYELEFGKNLPVGEYNFVCDPHTALGMKGRIIVTQ